MSGQPAARVGDTIQCPVPQATPAALPHAPPPGLPIVPLGAPTVLIGGSPAARVGDHSMCVAPAPTPNAILRGAFPVPIGGSPAARATDSGTHPGSVVMPPCCPTVLIGLAGTTGNLVLGTQACQGAAAGRNPAAGSTDGNGTPLPSGTAGQSYNNCGVESSRQIINQAGGNMSQEALLNQAISSNLASQPAIGSSQPWGSGTVPVTAANQMYFSGGTNSVGRATLLTNNGVPASTMGNAMAPALADAEIALSQGRGVIAAIDVGGMPGWGSQTGSHAIVVTGYDYDDDGNITGVHYNDTGTGVCNQVATPAQFQNALNNRVATFVSNGQTPLPPLTVTNAPIW